MTAERERLERVLAALRAVEYGAHLADRLAGRFHCGVCACCGTEPVVHCNVESGEHNRWEEPSAWKPCPIPGAIADVEALLAEAPMEAP